MRSRTPVASKTALASAAGTGVDAASPTPSGGWSADEAEALVRFQRRLAIDLHIERAIAEEVAVADRGAAIFRAHDAIGNLQISRRPIEALGRLGEKRLTRGGRRLAELNAAAGDAVAAGGRALIGRQRSVALDHRDALERDVELLADELAHGGRFFVAAVEEIDPAVLAFAVLLIQGQ